MHLVAFQAHTRRANETAPPPPPSQQKVSTPPDAKRTSAQTLRKTDPPAAVDGKSIGSRGAQPIGALSIDGDGLVIRRPAAADGKATVAGVLALDAEAAEELQKDFELATFVSKTLEKAPRPVPPALVGVLAERVRKRVMAATDAGAANLFKGLLIDLGHPAVSLAQLKPVLREILHESMGKDVVRTCVAMRSLCALFPDDALPPDWIATLLECAQSLAAARPLQALSITLGQLMDSIISARPEAARTGQTEELLRQAIAMPVEPPAYHLGLSGWVQVAASDGQGAALVPQVLRALDATPGLSIGVVSNVIVTLTSMVMRQGEPTPAELTARLLPLLQWTMERGEGQVPICEAIAMGLTRASEGRLGAQGLLAVVQALAQAGGAQFTLPGRLTAARLINVLTPLETSGTSLPPALNPPATTGSGSQAGTEAAAAARNAQVARVIALTISLLPGPEARDSKSAGASAAQELDDVYNLEGPTLVHLGRSLVMAQGGASIDAVALNAMAQALATSALDEEAAGLLLYGMALAAGGAGMNAPRLAALAAPLVAAGIPRGTALTCHLVPALSGPAGGPPTPSPAQLLSQALASLSASQRSALGIAPGAPGLPEALALGIALGRGPLTALHGSVLSGPDQVRCIAAACCAADGLDAATLSSEVLQCVLLSASDVDLALAAAKWFLLGSGACLDEGALRQLRAALVAQTLRQAAKYQGPNADTLLALRLEEIANLYSHYCLRVLPPESTAPVVGKDGKDGKAAGQSAADPRIAFLRSEAALLAAGPQAETLAPVVMKLRALTAALTAPPYTQPAG